MTRIAFEALAALTLLSSAIVALVIIFAALPS